MGVNSVSSCDVFVVTTTAVAADTTLHHIQDDINLD
jgi:hypothetical protein